MTNREFRPGRGYTKEDWDAVDSPDATEEELAKARPFAETFPELAASIRRSQALRRGKTELSVQIDADIATKLRASGPDWPNRVNAALRKLVES